MKKLSPFPFSPLSLSSFYYCTRKKKTCGVDVAPFVFDRYHEGGHADADRTRREPEKKRGKKSRTRRIGLEEKNGARLASLSLVSIYILKEN